jgi:hypothetical protein
MLPSFITEAERFASLEGNVGRKVTRHLEQLFEHGIFACTFDCPSATDLVDDALFVIRMQKCMELQKEYAGTGFSICVQTQELPSQVKVVVIPLTTPSTLREKQELLAAFARVMRGFVVVAAFTSREVLDKARLEHFERESFDSDNLHYKYLSELVEGNYTNLSRTAGNVVTLAIALNPTVDDRMRELYAADRIAA